MLHNRKTNNRNHWLCGSGSTMLMATGFVNGNHWFLTPHKFNLP